MFNGPFNNSVDKTTAYSMINVQPLAPVEEHSPHPPMVKGSSLATDAGTGTENYKMFAHYCKKDQLQCFIFKFRMLCL